MKIVYTIGLCLFIGFTASAQVEKVLEECNKERRIWQQKAQQNQKLAQGNESELVNLRASLAIAQSELSVYKNTGNTGACNCQEMTNLATLLSTNLKELSKQSDTINAIKWKYRDLEDKTDEVERALEDTRKTVVQGKKDFEAKQAQLESKNGDLATEIVRLKIVIERLQQDSQNFELRVDTLITNTEILQDTFNLLDRYSNYSIDAENKLVHFNAHRHEFKEVLISIPYTAGTKGEKAVLDITPTQSKQLLNLAQMVLKSNKGERIVKIRIKVIGEIESKFKTDLFFRIVRELRSKYGFLPKPGEDEAKYMENFDKDDGSGQSIIQMSILRY
jgi:DNA repair exonuclease SbcCD ATPase subunit